MQIMETIDTIEKVITERRTVKPQQYNGHKIEKTTIERLLQLADWAPTHGLTEPWRFVVFAGEGVHRFCQDHADLYKNNTAPDMFMKGSYEKLIDQGHNASHIIAVFSKRGTKSNITKLEEICATAAAVQNILIGAEALGIAAFWSTGGQTLKPSMKSYLQLLEEDEMIGLLYMGYSDAPKSPGRRLTPVEEKVMWYNR